jgi:acyl carrier protein
MPPEVTSAPGISDEAALRIARFIVTDLKYPGPIDDLIGDAPVQLAEAIDSAALLELVTFVEDAFEIQIEDEEIVPEMFGTVDDLVRFVDVKRRSTPGRDGGK